MKWYMYNENVVVVFKRFVYVKVEASLAYMTYYIQSDSFKLDIGRSDYNIS
jgi:hypothetical protein